jgi:metallophosphoesterase (TIGR00282 family)
MLKILFIGDVSGSVGRDVVKQVLPKIRNEQKPDLVIANIENAAGGVGVTREVISELTSYGIDLCTSGDHTFGIKDFVEELDTELPFIRPANYEAKSVPGVGYKVLDLGAKGTVAVINILGQELFTNNPRVRSPFWFIDELLTIPEITDADIRFIDFHAETTSEKLSFAWYVRDRVEAVVGTHTHVATADNRILDGKVAYVSDTGQVGPYAASLWVDFENVVHNFKYPFRKPFVLAENGPKIFNSVIVSFENFSPVKIDRVDVVVD